MGFCATENGQYGLLPVFEALSNLPNALGGYACTKIFYSWNSVTLDLGGHICQIMSFEDPYGALERNIPEKKSLFCYVNYEQK